MEPEQPWRFALTFMKLKPSSRVLETERSTALCGLPEPRVLSHTKVGWCHAALLQISENIRNGPYGRFEAEYKDGR